MSKVRAVSGIKWRYYGELATQGFAQNLNQEGQQITRKNLNIQPTIEIRPGFRFNVFVNKDLTLEVYHNS